MYHRLGEGRRAEREAGEHLYAVSPGDFEAQLEATRSADCTVLPLDEACAAGPKAPDVRNPAAITFDDGNASDHAVALAALARRRLPASFFVTPAWVGEPGFMGWPEVRELVAAGMTVGAHGLEHVPLSSLSREKLREQLTEARRVLQARLGQPPAWLALPGGFGGRREVEVAREAGFRHVLGSVPRLARPDATADPIPRFAVRRGESLASFRALLEQRRPVRLRHWLRYRALGGLRTLVGSRAHARLRHTWLRLKPDL
jgi:peptidoglycan/xylan/chitin deacetylase (PgdA/CDA1 family)